MSRAHCPKIVPVRSAWTSSRRPLRGRRLDTVAGVQKGGPAWIQQRAEASGFQRTHSRSRVRAPTFAPVSAGCGGLGSRRPLAADAAVSASHSGAANTEERRPGTLRSRSRLSQCKPPPPGVGVPTLLRAAHRSRAPRLDPRAAWTYQSRSLAGTMATSLVS